MRWNKTVITYLIAFFLAFTTALRGMVQYSGQSSQWTVYSLLAIFFVLFFIEPWLSHRSNLSTSLYLSAQTIVVAMLLITPTRAGDYFSVLFVSLAMQAIHVYGPRIGFRWIGLFSVVAAFSLIHKLGWDIGLALAIQMPVVYLFVGAFMAATRAAETARGQSQRLLTELEATHEQLQLYTAQAEELAAVEERNRLARDLHDSVTQTIFSVTLNAQAAQILLERDPLPRDELATQVKRLQEQSQGALLEMRSLINQLRPTTVAEEGLIQALRKHIAGLERCKDLHVDLQITDDKPELGIKQQQELFRVVQEALNNVSKHAQTDRAYISLKSDGAQFSVLIEDHGSGFDPADQAKHQVGIGLRSMRERVEGIGGTITIESCPQSGTRIHVNVPMEKENS